MQRLREVVRGQVQPEGSRPDPLQHQALRLLQVPQGLRSQVVPVQARGVLLHEDVQRKKAGGRQDLRLSI